MNKKLILLLSSLLLCSCNEVKPIESTTESTNESTEKSDTVVEPSVTLTAIEGETEKDVIVYQSNELMCANAPITFSTIVVDKLNMWERFTNILSVNEFNVEYLNKNKDAILSKSSKEVRYGLNYIYNRKCPELTIYVDGKNNKFGYYCMVLRCFDATKYEFTYQEDDKKMTFDMWLPKENCVMSYSFKFYETIEEYSKDAEKYCLNY